MGNVACLGRGGEHISQEQLAGGREGLGGEETTAPVGIELLPYMRSVPPAVPLSSRLRELFHVTMPTYVQVGYSVQSGGGGRGIQILYA